MIVNKLSNDKNVLDIAIIRSSSIGDVVLASACLNYLQKIDLAVNVLWIGRRPSLDLIKEAYPAVMCLEIEQSREVLEQLSEVDLIVDLQKNVRSRFLCFRVFLRSRIPTVRPKKAAISRWLMVLIAHLRGRCRSLPSAHLKSSKFQFQKMVSAIHEGLIRLNVGGAAFSSALSEARPNLPISDCEELLSAENLPWARWIAIGVGAAYETKQAPVEVVSAALMQCQSKDKKGPIGLILLGSDLDVKYANELVSKLRWLGPVHNYCGSLSLWQTAIVIQRHAKIVIANDSALAHIAEAVGVPCVVLFGPTIEAFGFAPWHNGSSVFSKNLGCRPCSRHGKQTCRYEDRRCFMDLPVDEIASCVLDKL